MGDRMGIALLLLLTEPCFAISATMTMYDELDQSTETRPPTEVTEDADPAGCAVWHLSRTAGGNEVRECIHYANDEESAAYTKERKIKASRCTRWVNTDPPGTSSLAGSYCAEALEYWVQAGPRCPAGQRRLYQCSSSGFNPETRRFEGMNGAELCNSSCVGE